MLSLKNHQVLLFVLPVIDHLFDEILWVLNTWKHNGEHLGIHVDNNKTKTVFTLLLINQPFSTASL